MKRIIVTGPNGAGKSHVANLLHAERSEIPIISFDAIKLTHNWEQRSRQDVDEQLSLILQLETWILEGGPSLLSQAIDKADGVIWLDPPEYVRAWRLLIRPCKKFGRTRPELPSGNIDWPLEQYRFAYNSFKNRKKFKGKISNHLNKSKCPSIFHCKNQKEIKRAIDIWRNAAY